MIIAIMSDLHDNVTAWQIIARQLADQKIEALINCGDTAAPAMLMEMAKTFSGQIHTVFGNVADKETETTKAKELPNVTHYGEAGEVALGGRQIFFNHYPAIARQRAQSGMYDLVCYGHDHTKHAELIGRTTLLNPGTAGGMFQYPTYATIDLTNMKINWHNVTL
jgi:uncharacterized protein